MKKTYDKPILSLKRFTTEEIMSTSSGDVSVPEGSVDIDPVPDNGTIDELD